jgi:tRNA pseudouridine-54 N-methylase
VISLAKGSPDDLKIISFPGKNLRRVSPDERSISFFLMKALSIAEELTTDSLEIMDNGIEVRRSSLKSFLETIAPARIYLSIPELSSESVDDREYEDSCLIYSSRKKFDSIEEDPIWIQEKLPYFPHPERLILEVNMIVDMKKAS